MFKKLIIILFLLISIVYAKQVPSILILHSYSQEYPWTKGQHQGFIKGLDELSLDIFTEYLDTKRLSYTQEYKSFFFNYLQNKYSDLNPKIVYVSDDNALTFILKYKEKLFPEAIVVFSGINNVSIKTKLDSSKFIGVFEEKNPNANIKFIEEIFPSKKNIYFVGDNSNTDKAIMHDIKNIEVKYPKFNFTFLSNKEISKITEELNKLPPSIVLLTTIGKFVDKDSNVMSISQAIKKLTKNNKHVVMSMEDAYLKNDVIGGYVTSSIGQGSHAGKITLQLLKGTPFDKVILSSNTPHAYIFNRQELKKHNISLPNEIEKNAIIINEDVSFWLKYESLLQYLFLVIISLFITVLLIALYTYRKKNLIIEEKSKHLEEKTEELMASFSKQEENEKLKENHAKILKMIATGVAATEIYDEIALMYEERHPGMRCSLLELKDGILLHGGAPSMPQEYCDAVHGLKNGPNVGSCGASTYTGKRMIVENIETHPNWSDIKQFALPHGMRSCWSEPIKDSKGNILGAFGMYYDYPALPSEEESKDLISAAWIAGIIMEREKNQKHINNLAYTDSLTLLPNRTSFYHKLEDSIQSFKRSEEKFAILYIDLDDFKNVNDTLGHDTGDILLKEIAKRLTKLSRNNDIAARLSGDEFCLLINNIDDNYDAAHVAKRCLEILSTPLLLENRNFTPSCSIGISQYPDDGEDIENLIKAADTALYFSKEKGKNQYSFYTTELTAKAERLFKVEHYLREAIENEELTIVYQPQVNISLKKVIGVEVLSRWNHPVLGAVSPVEFIPVAERIGMIKQLTEWVLKTACAQAVEWSNQGYNDIRISVNVSPIHFSDPSIIDLIHNTINSTGMTASNLELEVTEATIQNSEDNIAIFKSLKDLGVLIAIDDFGTGYSSFASLKHISLDCIKIDKYFMQDMLDDEQTKFLVEGMIHLGHNLGCGIIAEGVENESQLKILEKMNCETIQGYFISKPLSADNMYNYISKPYM